MVHWFRYIIISALILWILSMFLEICHAGMEFVNRYDKECFVYKKQVEMLEQSRNIAEIKARMAEIKDRIAVEKDQQFKEALQVLDEALDESKLFEIYARRKEIAEESRKVLEEVRGKFGSVGASGIYMGSEVVYAD